MYSTLRESNVAMDKSAIWTHFIDVNVDMLILHGKVFNFQSLADGQLS